MNDYSKILESDLLRTLGRRSWLHVDSACWSSLNVTIVSTSFQEAWQHSRVVAVKIVDLQRTILQDPDMFATGSVLMGCVTDDGLAEAFANFIKSSRLDRYKVEMMQKLSLGLLKLIYHLGKHLNVATDEYRHLFLEAFAQLLKGLVGSASGFNYLDAVRKSLAIYRQVIKQSEETSRQGDLVHLEGKESFEQYIKRISLPIASAIELRY